SAIATEIDDLISQLKDVETEIRRLSPHYAALTEPQTLTVSEMQKLLDQETLLLEYSMGEKRSHLLVLTPENISTHILPPRAEIEAAARRVYGLLTNRQLPPGGTEARLRAPDSDRDKDYRVKAAELSRMLLAPAASQLGHKRLLIVASGTLQYLPFGVLPGPEPERQKDSGTLRQASRGTGKRKTVRPAAPVPRHTVETLPLVASHEIINLPSASVLALLRREYGRRQPASLAVAVLADPVFTQEDARVKAAIASRQKGEDTASGDIETSAMRRAIRSVTGEDRAGLQRLSFSRDEAEAIVSLAPASSALNALDFKASRATALSDDLNQYRIIHFATHGLLDSAQPALSGLALSLVDESGKPQDGYLRLNEIYNLKLNADLVVLSACQTGLGKEVRGEGLIGLTRGFMYAGTPRVVASLWQV